MNRICRIESTELGRTVINSRLTDKRKRVRQKSPNDSAETVCGNVRFFESVGYGTSLAIRTVNHLDHWGNLFIDSQPAFWVKNAFESRFSMSVDEECFWKWLLSFGESASSICIQPNSSFMGIRFELIHTDIFPERFAVVWIRIRITIWITVWITIWITVCSTSKSRTTASQVCHSSKLFYFVYSNWAQVQINRT